jgi:hypothetical protein
MARGDRESKRDGERVENCREFTKKSRASSEQRKSRTETGRNDNEENNTTSTVKQSLKREAAAAFSRLSL